VGVLSWTRKGNRGEKKNDRPETATGKNEFSPCIGIVDQKPKQQQEKEREKKNRRRKKKSRERPGVTGGKKKRGCSKKQRTG